MRVAWAQALASASDTQCAGCYGATVRTVLVQGKLTGWNQMGSGLFWPVRG